MCSSRYICTVDRTLGALLKPYNQSEIARHVGVPRGRVNRWANGESVPEVQHLPRLAEILRIPVEELALVIAGESQQRAAAS